MTEQQELKGILKSIVAAMLIHSHPERWHTIRDEFECILDDIIKNLNNSGIKYEHNDILQALIDAVALALTMRFRHD